MPEDQPHLFDTQPPAWEQDAAESVCAARIVLPSGLTRQLDYRVPDALREQIEAGRRVRVPLGRGNRSVVGYCVDVLPDAKPDRPLKEIEAVIDERRLLSNELLEITHWMADYYLCPWGQVLDSVIPAGVRSGAGTRMVTLLTVPEAIARARSAQKLPAKQAAVLDYVLAHPESTPADVAAAVGCTQAPVTTLRRKGLLLSTSRRMAVEADPEAVTPQEPHLKMNEDQTKALKTIMGAIREGRNETILIHGVTGSGKTEVYLQAIREVVSYGRQAIVLVPEISLTPQTVSRFRSRFGRVAVLHSHLSDVERHRQWARIAAGGAAVVVGARSAIFAPTPHLGLIVIDEEHESSFKQDTAPRYHAREVAERRAAAAGVPLLLGSATPALESHARALDGRYTRVEMPRRISNLPLPGVATIDLRAHQQDRHARGAISRQLHRAMEEALDDEGQVILLLNRRGFSTHIQCPSCGQASECPECEIALTHHRGRKRAVCHYCDYHIPVPSECRACGFKGLNFFGRGTERLEDEVQQRFPRYTSLRMDTDTMSRPGSHEKALDRFRSGEIRILLGTQMIAKGLDFPNVTLVGVINADTALHLPDFRAAEKTFQLITQVAGRTGRSKRGGHVLVQTCEPDHPAIRAAIRHDYALFSAEELPMRKALGYPPYGAMVRILVRGPVEMATREFATSIGERIAAACREADFRFRLLGPAPAPFAKLRGKYRFAIQLQAEDPLALSRAVRAATEEIKTPEQVQWIADVDPLEMM
ncbi:MAG: primosomal protein N' [Planctomycetota bacterium]|nr:primosomal protein N' [Planctomycetota bacterium]